MPAKKTSKRTRRGGGTVMYGFQPGPAGMPGWQGVANGTGHTGGRRRKRGGGGGLTVDVAHPVTPGHPTIVGYTGGRRRTRRNKKLE